MSEKDSKNPQMNQTDSKKELLKEKEAEQVAGGLPRFKRPFKPGYGVTKTGRRIPRY